MDLGTRMCSWCEMGHSWDRFSGGELELRCSVPLPQGEVVKARASVLAEAEEMKAVALFHQENRRSRPLEEGLAEFPAGCLGRRRLFGCGTTGFAGF